MTNTRSRLYRSRQRTLRHHYKTPEVCLSQRVRSPPVSASSHAYNTGTLLNNEAARDEQPLRFVKLRDDQPDPWPQERAASAMSEATQIEQQSWSPFADTTWAIPPPDKLVDDAVDPSSSLFALPYDWQQSIAQHNNLTAAPVLAAATKLEQDERLEDAATVHD